jgi:hypothetical protein
VMSNPIYTRGYGLLYAKFPTSCIGEMKCLG